MADFTYREVAQNVRAEYLLSLPASLDDLQGIPEFLANNYPSVQWSDITLRTDGNSLIFAFEKPETSNAS